MESKLWRYTNLASALHILQNKCITLLSPKFWDDKNDAFFMEQYKKQNKAKTLLALCFTSAPEKYHHWSVFAPGLHGIRFEFDKSILKETLKKKGDKIKYRDVNYKKICKEKINANDLPFVKIIPYKDEKEFRIVYESRSHDIDTYDVGISLDAISVITLSPWIAPPLEESVTKILRGITYCESMEIYRSTLIENEKWKKKAMP